jgi:ABC-type transport system involved in Fe-S cluster assembly fused permease/ATPase subunit
VPTAQIISFALLRFGVSAFEEVQRLVYLRVKEVAYHEIACRTFAHLHGLSLSWHISKRTGVVLRAVDRGISSASTVVEMLFLRLVSTA